LKTDSNRLHSDEDRGNEMEISRRQKEYHPQFNFFLSKNLDGKVIGTISRELQNESMHMKAKQ